MHMIQRTASAYPVSAPSFEEKKVSSRDAGELLEELALVDAMENIPEEVVEPLFSAA